MGQSVLACPPFARNIPDTYCFNRNIFNSLSQSTCYPLVCNDLLLSYTGGFLKPNLVWYLEDVELSLPLFNHCYFSLTR